MAGANSNIQLTELDFDAIKNNLKTYLQSQDVLKDYNYEGSALSTLLDILAYNTHYNAYYLNMVANELFLDTAARRSSVVSLAKMLNYTPKSVKAPAATVHIIVSDVTDPELTLPKYTRLLSEAVDGTNYTFTTTDVMSTVVNLATNTAEFYNVNIKQGIPSAQNFIVNNTTNPTSKLLIKDANIDTSSIQVTVYQSITSTNFETFTLAENYLDLDGTSAVYFLEESTDGYYQIYFGDGILGKKLTDGNVVRINYISSNGTASHGANSFVMLDTVGGYSNAAVQSVTSSASGSERETMASIRFHAPKVYGSQSRAVSKDDYIAAIQNNKMGHSFDAVNVWGGEENDPPVYGSVLIAMKPKGAYTLTEAQKNKIILDVINPISVMTVKPKIVDPDYTYLQITAEVLYDPKKTTLSAAELQNAVKQSIANYAAANLNTFNSTFSMSDFNTVVKNSNASIVANDMSIKVQKKFFPSLVTPTTYKLYYGIGLKKGMFQSGITSTPAITLRNPSNLATSISGLFIEEVPSSSGGIEKINVLNPGFSYQYAPTVEIRGDGTGATAIATINNNGTIKEITVTNKGTGYTSALVVITAKSGDTTGQSGAAYAILEGQYGTLRTYYNDNQNVKTILNPNVGSVDYVNGVITLDAFNPLAIDDPLGQFVMTANPSSSIISSSFNRIITVDPFDANAIIVNVTPKTT